MLYSGCELMPRLNWINPTAFSREYKPCTHCFFKRQIMYIVDILPSFHVTGIWWFPFLLLKNCNIDLRHFTKRILQIVPLGKEEQWCDKVTMYSRERNGGGEREPKMLQGSIVEISRRIIQKPHQSLQKCIEILLYFPMFWSKQKLIAHPTQGRTASLLKKKEKVHFWHLNSCLSPTLTPNSKTG